MLKTVDEEQNPVEWIVSVSMLTEGWDVKNVFQIVPHEQRAFNSKLLISQVLGRGLRMPKEYFGTEIQPKVTVYNHPAWGQKIDDLVYEIAEITNVITSSVIEKSDYNFELHKIDIKKETVNTKQISQENKDIKLPISLGFSTSPRVKSQTFTNIRTHRLTTLDTEVSYGTYSVSEATNAIYSMIYVFDMNRNTKISEKVSKEYIQKLILKELNSINEFTVSEQNLQKAKQSFGVLFRSAVGSSNIEDLYQDIQLLNTNLMGKSNISESSFKNNGTLITCEEYLENLPEDDIKLIDELKIKLKDPQKKLIAEEDSFYITGKIITDLTLDQYKSPLNITLLSHKPERDFIILFINQYSQYIDSWIKSKDKGFYAIPYIHRPGTHSLQKDFNPDFFFKKGKYIIVVEIKSDDDSTVNNKDKLEGAIVYFHKLNEKLNGKYYYEFHFLDSRDYKQFFENRIKNNFVFKSSLHADLESKSRDELKEGR